MDIEHLEDLTALRTRDSWGGWGATICLINYKYFYHFLNKGITHKHRLHISNFIFFILSGLARSESFIIIIYFLFQV